MGSTNAQQEQHRWLREVLSHWRPELFATGENDAAEEGAFQLDPKIIYDALRPTGAEPELPSDPSQLVPTLRPYQRRAVAWMVRAISPVGIPSAPSATLSRRGWLCDLTLGRMTDPRACCGCRFGVRLATTVALPAALPRRSIRCGFRWPRRATSTQTRTRRLRCTCVPSRAR